MSNKAQKKSLFDQRVSLAFWTDCLTKNLFHKVTHLYTDAPFQQCFLDKWTKWRRVFRATVWSITVTAPVQVSRCPGVQVSHTRHWTPKLMWTVRPADCRVRQSACVNPWKTAARYAQQVRLRSSAAFKLWFVWDTFYLLYNNCSSLWFGDCT